MRDTKAFCDITRFHYRTLIKSTSLSGSAQDTARLIHTTLRRAHGELLTLVRPVFFDPR